MADKNLILAGDIGGTHARFGCLVPKSDGGWTVHNFTKVKGADFPTFDAALDDYVSGLKIRPNKSAFAAAGAVQGGHIKLTNIDWEISAKDIASRHGFKACGLYNDFAGMTRSVAELGEEDFTQLRGHETNPDAPILVAGAGTGFGVGYLIPISNSGQIQSETILSETKPPQKKWHVMSTEGGHIAYSPQTPLECELLQNLRREHGFVSLELVSSGKGLPHVHKAICEIHGQIYKAMPPHMISEKALAGDPICRDISSIRAAAVMGAISDLALSGGARGGIVLAGGVTERMADFYMQPTAISRYLERGPQSNYVKDISMRLLTSPMAPLIGAAALLMDQRYGSA